MIALGGARDGRVVVRSLGRDMTLYPREIGAVHLLGHPDPLEFECGAHALTVRLPERLSGRLSGRSAEGTMPVLRIDAAAG